MNFLPAGEEGTVVVEAVALEVAVNQGLVLLQHMADLVHHEYLWALPELVVDEVQLTECLVGLEGPEDLVDALVAEHVAVEAEHLNLALVVGEQLLDVARALGVNLAVVQVQFLDGVVDCQPLGQLLQPRCAELVVA